VSKRLRESTAGASSVSALLRGAIAAHEQRARKAKVTKKAEAAQRPILPGARVLEAATPPRAQARSSRSSSSTRASATAAT
jgi:hypothetical protein